jgi:hypothetical protein
VQLRLPWLVPRETGGRKVSVGGRVYDVAIARHRRARRFVVRLAGESTLRLTVPRGAAIADGLAFVAKQQAWIERERARHSARIAGWTGGTPLWFRGDRVTMAIESGVAICGGERIPLKPSADVRATVEAHLAALAKRELPPRCFTLAAQHSLDVTRVVIRNQRSRWGSCSSRRAIALNWRLIQMPASVSDYVILHELMHMRQANHSRKFWREVESVCAEWRDAERWLKKHGREIL